MNVTIDLQQLKEELCKPEIRAKGLAEETVLNYQHLIEHIEETLSFGYSSETKLKYIKILIENFKQHCLEDK